jgi:hypothetical protein
LKPNRPKDWLTQGPFVEGVLLTVYPTYYNGSLVKPKSIKIHIESLSDLISSETPKYLSGNPNDQNSEDENVDLQAIYGENINPVSRHILRVLEKGSLGARYLCKQILQVLRFEYTKDGLKLVVHGVDHHYILIPTPEEIDQSQQRKNKAVIKIQAAWRGTRGRKRANEVRDLQNRIHELQRHLAIIHLQRIVRGYITRKRYLLILDALQNLPAQEDLQLIQPPVVLSESPHRVDEPVIVTIKGSEVEVKLIPQENLEKRFCDCLLTVTDILSSKSTTITIISSQFTRIWSSFRQLPLVFDEAVIRLRRITLNDLKQVDLVGKNDPYVKIKSSDALWECSTVPVEEGGADVEWIISDEEILGGEEPKSITRLSQNSYQFSSKYSELFSKSLNILIYDKNSFRSDVLIGETSIALSQLTQLTGYQEEITITREIRKKGKGTMATTGYVSIIFDLVPVETAPLQSKLKKSDIKSVEDILKNSQMKKEFLGYLCKQFLDLFLSRGNNVMILRLIGV